MSFLDKLEKRFGFLAIHNLTLYIVVGQIAVYLMAASKGPMVEEFLEYVRFSLDNFVNGRPWTVISFLLLPRHFGFGGMDVVWVIISWLMLYWLGGQLERAWGAFRFNLFIATGVLGVVAASFFAPSVLMTNYYLLTSVWFAFFALNPEMPFFFGIKAKWFAVFFAVMLGLEFLASPLYQKTLIIGSLVNVPIFFGREWLAGAKAKRRVVEREAAREKAQREPFHVCSVCGATDLSHPERDFRYRAEGAICSDCADKS